MKELPSDDPTSYTTEELTKFINQSWMDLQKMRADPKTDPVLKSNVEIKIRVCRNELATRNKLKIQQPKEQQSEPLSDLISMKDFLDKPADPARWLMEDCLPLNSSSILVAAPKTGKTHFAVALSIAVARGWPFLGRGMQKGRAGYVFLDGHYEELREVFQKFKVTANDDIMIHTGAGGDGAVKWAIEQIQKFGIKFLVIDTLQKVFRFKNVNDYSEVTNTIEPLAKAQQDYGCCALYLHHAGKPNPNKGDLDSAIGSSALRGNFYTFMHLKRLIADDWKSPRVFRTDQRGGRNFDEVTISNGDDGYIERVGTIKEAWVSVKAPEVIQFITENPGCQQNEILMAVDGHRNIIHGAIKELLKKNDIERTGEGKKGHPFRYYLAGSIFADEPENSLFRG